jgi:hypothetical protein
MPYFSRSYTLAVTAQTDFPVTFPYIDDSHVQVLTKTSNESWLDAVTLTPDVDYEWTSSSLIHTIASVVGLDVLIKRVTPGDDLLVRLTAPSPVLSAGINAMDVQLLYLGQEAADESAFWVDQLNNRALLLPENEVVGGLIVASVSARKGKASSSTR